MTLRNALSSLTLALVFGLAAPVHGQQTPPTGKPFSLPFNTPPGPNTWLLSQQYGNTVGAFNYGKYWYAAGQNLHFGVDFWAPCNTPVVAIGDGVIDQVDNMSFGLEPHNLTIFHQELRLTSIYGHLNVKPTVLKGQPVRRGEIIAFSGDPDRTCSSRPHLHLEVRSSNYSTAFNPMALIDADWAALASIGYQGFGGFVKNLYLPNLWQWPFDQPEVAFNQDVQNSFTVSWPPPERDAPAPQVFPAFEAPIPPDARPTLRRLTPPGCCSLPWWSPDSRAVRYWDGQGGQLASMWEVGIDAEPGTGGKIADGPPSLLSNDGQWRVEIEQGRVTVVNVATGAQTPLATGGAWPRHSPGSTRLLWHRHPADDIPGGIPPLTEIWIANADGTGRALLGTQQGGRVYWLDDERLLMVEPVGRASNESTLSIYTLSSRRKEQLATFKNLRGLSIAPGGQVLLFYLPFQDDPNASGVYGMLAQPGAVPVRLPFFGSYRWRDSKSILYLLYAGGGQMALAQYDITTGEQRQLTDPATQPFSIVNDDWTVSPDGKKVVFWSGTDSAIYVIRLTQE